MDIDEAVRLTQDRLAQEGGSMSELLKHTRKWLYPNLIGDTAWSDVLACTSNLPITMGALPFGFEIPLHEFESKADFGVSLATRTKSAEDFLAHAQSTSTNEDTSSVVRLLQTMDSKESGLEEIVGRKMMLEYDIGSKQTGEGSQPGMFLRPSEQPIFGVQERARDVLAVVDALVSSVGWESNDTERKHVEGIYQHQPRNTRIDSFGIFPARKRGIRLGVMGFESREEICSFLSNVGWSGGTSIVDELISRYSKRLNLIGLGANIDVRQDGVGPVLGLTLITKERYTENSRYWLDDLSEWSPFLSVLEDEDVVHQHKLQGLADWISKPTVLFGKSGRYVLLRGIHHIKLVVSENRLQRVKAYLFMVISGAVSF